MKEMGFIQAIIEIHKRKDLSLCDDILELSGDHPSICVFKNGSFIGKLRWPSNKYSAHASEQLTKEITK